MDRFAAGELLVIGREETSDDMIRAMRRCDKRFGVLVGRLSVSVQEPLRSLSSRFLDGIPETGGRLRADLSNRLPSVSNAIECTVVDISETVGDQRRGSEDTVALSLLEFWLADRGVAVGPHDKRVF